MLFFFLLPFLSFVLLTLIMSGKAYSGRNFYKIRIAVLNSFLVNGIFVLLVTESLSFFKMIRFDTLFTAWLVWVVALFIYARCKISFKLFKITGASLKTLFINNRWIAAVILLFVVSFIIALIYPTNNFDSLTYHMARVAHWQQNESIAHYQTHILRQIEFPPFAEWIILHLQVLTGGDRFANAVQLFFLGGCIVVVSLIAKQLGADRRQQLLSAVMACFIPMAVLQSNTTQNDIVAAFYLLAFVYLTLKLLRQNNLNLFLLAGVSLGLAWLTKSTNYVFSLIFCGWYVWILIKTLRENWRKAFLVMLVPALAIAINSGHYYRNIVFAGSPFGYGTDGAVNEAFEVKPLVFLAVKNLMCHFPVSRALKDKVHEQAIRWDIDPDDPKYCQVEMKYMAEGFSFHEDYAQNLMHVLLIILCLVIYFARIRSHKRSGGDYLLFIGSLIGLTIVFSILLQWQPWGNRLETAMFMLFCVFLGIEMQHFKEWLRRVCVTAVIMYGFVTLSLSERHALLPLQHSILGTRFTYNDFIYDRELLDLKKHLDSTSCQKIGIYIGSDSWDYPYYKLLRRNGKGKRTLQHVFVQNASKMYQDDFLPDALITLEASVDKYTIGNRVYRRTGIYKYAVLFEAENSGSVK